MIKCEEYLGLVRSICKRYEFLNFVDREDIFQIGCLGLVIASKRYDESKGIQFNTYAFHIIRGTIQNVKRL